MVNCINLGKYSYRTSLLICETCIKRKQHRITFPNERERRTTKPLEIMHSNVCGPMRTKSMGNAKYFVTIIDDFPWKMWLYMLKVKRNCFKMFKEFKRLVETQSEHKIKTFGSDNDKEFVFMVSNRFLKDHGINEKTFTPYTPQQNGVVGRANRTIAEMTRNMVLA